MARTSCWGNLSKVNTDVRKAHPTKHTQKLMDVSAFAVMLTLNIAIHSTYKTMVMIRMYHPTKFDCKTIRNSVNIKQNIKKSYFDHNFMSPYILIIQAHIMTLTLKLANQLFSWHSGSKWFFTIPSLVTNSSVVQKISSGWTFTEILNHCCNLALKHSNLILLLATPAYCIPSNQIWLQSIDQQFRKVVVSQTPSWMDYISSLFLVIQVKKNKSCFFQREVARLTLNTIYTVS